MIPRLHESFGTPKRVFRVIVGGAEYDWSVNPRSPMYAQLLKKLVKAPLKCSINRLGEGLDTRYNQIQKALANTSGVF